MKGSSNYVRVMVPKRERRVLLDMSAEEASALLTASERLVGYPFHELRSALRDALSARPAPVEITEADEDAYHYLPHPRFVYDGKRRLDRWERVAPFDPQHWRWNGVTGCWVRRSTSPDP